MAAGAWQMTSLRVFQSLGTAAALDVRGCSSRATASLGARCGGFTANLSTTGTGWGQRMRRDVKLVASAVVDEAVSASQVESGVESLAMYFKAEGSLNENAVSKVTKVLEETEGVSKIKVSIDEGAATVELVKQTNIQATGVASSLVEIIEQVGFKMQALSLGFDDDDDEDDDLIDYDASTYSEEEEEASTE